MATAVILDNRDNKLMMFHDQTNLSQEATQSLTTKNIGKDQKRLHPAMLFLGQRSPSPQGQDSFRDVHNCFERNTSGITAIINHIAQPQKSSNMNKFPVQFRNQDQDKYRKRTHTAKKLRIKKRIPHVGTWGKIGNKSSKNPPSFRNYFKFLRKEQDYQAEEEIVDNEENQNESGEEENEVAMAAETNAKNIESLEEGEATEDNIEDDYETIEAPYFKFKNSSLEEDLQNEQKGNKQFQNKKQQNRDRKQSFQMRSSGKKVKQNYSTDNQNTNQKDDYNASYKKQQNQKISEIEANIDEVLKNSREQELEKQNRSLKGTHQNYNKRNNYNRNSQSNNKQKYGYNGGKYNSNQKYYNKEIQNENNDYSNVQLNQQEEKGTTEYYDKYNKLDKVNVNYQKYNHESKQAPDMDTFGKRRKNQPLSNSLLEDEEIPTNSNKLLNSNVNQSDKLDDQINITNPDNQTIQSNNCEIEIEQGEIDYQQYTNKSGNKQRSNQNSKWDKKFSSVNTSSQKDQFKNRFSNKFRQFHQQATSQEGLYESKESQESPETQNIAKKTINNDEKDSFESDIKRKESTDSISLNHKIINKYSVEKCDFKQMGITDSDQKLDTQISNEADQNSFLQQKQLNVNNNIAQNNNIQQQNRPFLSVLPQLFPLPNFQADLKYNTYSSNIIQQLLVPNPTLINQSQPQNDKNIKKDDIQEQNIGEIQQQNEPASPKSPEYEKDDEDDIAVNQQQDRFNNKKGSISTKGFLKILPYLNMEKNENKQYNDNDKQYDPMQVNRPPPFKELVIPGLSDFSMEPLINIPQNQKFSFSLDDLPNFANQFQINNQDIQNQSSEEEKNDDKKTSLEENEEFPYNEMLQKLDPQVANNLKEQFKALKQNRSENFNEQTNIQKKREDPRRKNQKQNLEQEQQQTNNEDINIEKQNQQQDNTKTLSFEIETTEIGVEPSLEDKQGSLNYKTIGSDKLMYSKTDRLISDKLQKILQEQYNKEQIELNNEQSNQDNVDLNLTDKNQMQKQKENRYYIENTARLCKRCRQPGHYERQCTVQIDKKCIFCMLEHKNNEQCQAKPCFNCLKPGHMNKDCPEQNLNNQRCNACKRKGHQYFNCGVIQLNRVNDHKKIAHLIQCFNCFKTGHINCNDFFKNRNLIYNDQLYNEDGTIENQC